MTMMPAPPDTMKAIRKLTKGLKDKVNAKEEEIKGKTKIIKLAIQTKARGAGVVVK